MTASATGAGQGEARQGHSRAGGGSGCRRGGAARIRGGFRAAAHELSPEGGVAAGRVRRCDFDRKSGGVSGDFGGG